MPQCPECWPDALERPHTDRARAAARRHCLAQIAGGAGDPVGLVLENHRSPLRRGIICCRQPQTMDCRRSSRWIIGKQAPLPHIMNDPRDKRFRCAAQERPVPAVARRDRSARQLLRQDASVRNREKSAAILGGPQVRAGSIAGARALGKWLAPGSREPRAVPNGTRGKCPPSPVGFGGQTSLGSRERSLVDPIRIELTTSSLRTRRSPN